MDMACCVCEFNGLHERSRKAAQERAHCDAKKEGRLLLMSAGEMLFAKKRNALNEPVFLGSLQRKIRHLSNRYFFFYKTRSPSPGKFGGFGKLPLLCRRFMQSQTKERRYLGNKPNYNMVGSLIGQSTQSIIQNNSQKQKTGMRHLPIPIAILSCPALTGCVDKSYDLDDIDRATSACQFLVM